MPAPTPLRPTDEGNGDTEAGEVLLYCWVYVHIDLLISDCERAYFLANVFCFFCENEVGACAYFGVSTMETDVGFEKQ